MSLTYEQAVCYIESFKSYRLGASWGVLSASFPGYAHQPRAGIQVNMLGGQGVAMQSLAQARPTILLCEVAQGLQPGDMIKALTGARAGRYYSIRLVVPNNLANELECEMEETRDVPEGVS